MSGGQDWANEMIESDGEKLSKLERIKKDIEHCRRQIKTYRRWLESERELLKKLKIHHDMLRH